MSAEMTLPVRIDLTDEDAIVQGSYWRREFAFMYADGTMWDVDGFLAEMMVKSTIGGPQILTLTTANGRLEVGVLGTAPNQYTLSMTLPHTATEGMADWGRGVYQVEFIDTFGRRIRTLEGHCTLSMEVNN